VKPYSKLFLLDGKTFYAFEPEDNAVIVNKKFSSDTLSAAVSFLWGKGNLVEEFNLKKVERPDYGPVVLELNPKKPQAGFTKLFFVIDPATGMVQTSVIFDTEGNENRITFSATKTNQNVPDSRFSFEIPKGASVKEL
jgi:outer membrane lipoprotein carrier protein